LIVQVVKESGEFIWRFSVVANLGAASEPIEGC